MPTFPWYWRIETDGPADAGAAAAVGRLSGEAWPLALAVCAADGRLDHWNQALVMLLGAPDQGAADQLAGLLGAAGVAAPAEILDRARTRGCLVNLRRSGLLHARWLRGMPLAGAGTVYAFLPAAAADGHDERLSRQLAQLAHDTRAPLAVIQGYAGLLATGVPGPVNIQQQEFLARIDQQVAELNRRFSMLVALAQQECGMRPLSAAPCELLACLEQVVETQGHLAAARKIDLHLTPGTASPVLDSIPELLEQFLAHLVGLAVAACPDAGRVSLQVSATASQAAVLLLGDGIPGADRLDLEVAQQLASRLGATLVGESNDDGRLTLVVNLPLASGSGAEDPAAAGPSATPQIPQSVR